MIRNLVLCADIGGTNTRLAVLKLKDGLSKLEVLEYRELKTAKIKDIYDELNRFIENYRAKKGDTIRQLSLAVAGPVDKERAKMTNGRLTISIKKLKAKTPIKKALLLNDFCAFAWGINSLSEKDFFVINKGISIKHATKAVIGAGTGLGKAILYYNPLLKQYIPLASEGGHADFPGDTEEEFELQEFVKKQYKAGFPVVYEDLVSGKGLERIYEFLSNKHFSKKSALPAPQISATIKDNRCSRETFLMFTRFYARCCRNFALETLALGGVYIGGGIAQANQALISKNFMREFTLNKTYQSMLKKIPVYIVINKHTSLYGAALAYKNSEIKQIIK